MEKYSTVHVDYNLSTKQHATVTNQIEEEFLLKHQNADSYYIGKIRQITEGYDFVLSVLQQTF